jgi:glycine/D-amino acid oxidase-like deaminating enzyme
MSPDIIVIGGGLAGTALTYALARAGVKVLLLEQGRIGGEASGATMGMALWIGMSSETEIVQAVEGFRRLPRLEDELEADLSYRLLPSLVLAPSEAILAKLRRQADRLQQAGLPARLANPADIAELEPALDCSRIIGALYAEQGHLDGAALTRAYAKAAQRLGAGIREFVSVRGFAVERRRIVAVHTDQATFTPGQVVLAAGAWTRQLAVLAGIDVPVYQLHGQALATAPLAAILNCMLMVARPGGYSDLERRVADSVAAGGSWTNWQDEKEALDTSLVQLRDGRILLGQISRASPRPRLSLRPTAIKRIQQRAARLVPVLADVPIQRSWIAPVSFTPTQEPMLGPLPGCQNLFVCAGFKSILITAPVASETLAQQIVTAGQPRPGRARTGAKILRR